MSSKKALTVYGYARISSTNPVTNPRISLAGQEKSIREWCKSKGFKLIETLKDVSGANKITSRPELIRLIYKALAKPADLIVVTNYDRFSRERGFFSSLLHFLKNFGVEVVALEHPRQKISDYLKANSQE